MDYSRYVNEILVTLCSSVLMSVLITGVGFWRWLRNRDDPAGKTEFESLSGVVAGLSSKVANYEKTIEDLKGEIQSRDKDQSELKKERAQLLQRVVDLEKSDKDKSEKLLKLHERLDKAEHDLAEEKTMRLAAEAGKVLAEKNSARWQGKFEGAIEIVQALPLIQAEIQSAVEAKSDTKELKPVEAKPDA